jgi:hypothetical protein
MVLKRKGSPHGFCVIEEKVVQDIYFSQLNLKLTETTPNNNKVLIKFCPKGSGSFTRTGT